MWKSRARAKPSPVARASDCQWQALLSASPTRNAFETSVVGREKDDCRSLATASVPSRGAPEQSRLILLHSPRRRKAIGFHTGGSEAPECTPWCACNLSGQDGETKHRQSDRITLADSSSAPAKPKHQRGLTNCVRGRVELVAATSCQRDYSKALATEQCCGSFNAQ